MVVKLATWRWFLFFFCPARGGADDRWWSSSRLGGGTECSSSSSSLLLWGLASLCPTLCRSRVRSSSFVSFVCSSFERFEVVMVVLCSSRTWSYPRTLPRRRQRRSFSYTPQLLSSARWRAGWWRTIGVGTAAVSSGGGGGMWTGEAATTGGARGVVGRGLYKLPGQSKRGVVDPPSVREAALKVSCRRWAQWRR